MSERNRDKVKRLEHELGRYQKKVGELMKQFGGTRVLIHYGGQSAVRSGVLISRATTQLPSLGSKLYWRYSSIQGKK